MASSPPPETSPEQHIPLAADAEPGPNWPAAKQLWGIAWEFHWAGFGVLFGILAVRSFIALAQVRTRQGFSRKPLYIATNALLLMLGTTRALLMFLDPYSSGDNGVKLPNWFARLLYGITFPCLTSSFCLIHLAFCEVAKVQIGPKKIHSVRFVISVIITHFALEITAAVAIAVRPHLAPLMIVCQSFFILWGFLLSAGFIYSGLKVIHRARRAQRQIGTIELRDAATAKANGARRKERTSKVAKVTFVTSILGFVSCALQIYSMFGVYGLYSRAVNPSPWPWWVFQTCFRLVEFCMACTIAFSVMQRSEQQINNRSDNK